MRLKTYQVHDDFEDERKTIEQEILILVEPSVFIEQLLQLFVEDIKQNCRDGLTSLLCQPVIITQLSYVHELGLERQKFYNHKHQMTALINIVRTFSILESDAQFLAKLKSHPRWIQLYIDIACYEPWDRVLTIIKDFKQSFENPAMANFWEEQLIKQNTRMPLIISALFITERSAETYQDPSITQTLVEELAWMWDTDTIEQLAKTFLAKPATSNMETVSNYIQLRYTAQVIRPFKTAQALKLALDDNKNRRGNSPSDKGCIIS